MPTARRFFAALLVVLSVAGGCAWNQADHDVAADRCASLAARGIRPCPPANLTVARVPVTNRTNGAVDQATAERWASASLRTEALYRWAVKNGNDGFLRSGAINDPRASSAFAREAALLERARNRHGSVHYVAPQIVGLTLLPVAAEVQTLQRGGGVATPFAFLVDQVGPATLKLTVPGQPDLVLVDAPAGQPYPVLALGTFKRDPQLGELWYSDGTFPCQGAELRAACRM